MQPTRAHTVVQGAIAGVLAGTAVALWFWIVDLSAAQPFRTPALLMGTLVGTAGTSEPTFRLVATYTLLHFGVFTLLGIAAASILRVAGAAPAVLLGALFGLGVLDSVHYGALLLTGTGVLSVLSPVHVLAANLLGGVVMMLYLHFATHAETPFGLARLRDHPLVTQGIVTGLIGGGAVALWFLVLDVVRGRPFFTPSALGSLVFFGAMSPSDVRVGAAIIGAYTLLHLVVFAVVGVALEWSARRVEHTPGLWLMAVLTLIVLEGLVVGTAGGLSGWVLGEVGYWATGVANLIAVVAMGTWVWRSHPLLRHQLLDTPVHTRM